MAETSTPTGLLIVAIQDLYAGECVWCDRLPKLSERIPVALEGFVSAERDRSAAQARRLEAMAEQLGAPPCAMPNIWLSAILDDAERDTRSIAAGALRAIALVGAFRKGKQAERVSYETAVGLARSLGLDDIAELLERSRDEELSADEALESLLANLLENAV